MLRLCMIGPGQAVCLLADAGGEANLVRSTMTPGDFTTSVWQ